MKELIIISIIIIVVYYSISPIKKVYIQYFRTNTINKFKNMCEEIKINMVIEDYLKVGADKTLQIVCCVLPQEISRNCKGI